MNIFSLFEYGLYSDFRPSLTSFATTKDSVLVMSCVCPHHVKAILSISLLNPASLVFKIKKRYGPPYCKICSGFIWSQTYCCIYKEHSNSNPTQA